MIQTKHLSLTNTLTTDAFLEALFEPDDLIEFRLIETWDDNGKRQSKSHGTLWTVAQSWASLLPQLISASKDEHANVFFGVNSRYSRDDGTKWGVSTIRSLWVDIDNIDPQEFDRRIATLILPDPNIIINSGHGIHAYWLLADPITLPCETTPVDKSARKLAEASDTERWQTVRRIETVVGRLLEALGGKAMRGTQDVSRILRLPHPYMPNRKNERNGQESVPVEMLRCETTPRHTLEAIEASLPMGETVKTVETVGTDRDKTIRHDDHHDTQDRIDTLIGQLDEQAPDRSGRDFHVCCELIHYGLKEQGAWSLVQSKSKFAERDYRYFSDTWGKALMAQSNRRDGNRKTVPVSYPFQKPETAKPAEFPLNALPSPVKAIVKEVSRIYGGDAGAPATWALVTLSGATGNLMRIVQQDQRLELSTHLYTVLVGESGSNKTITGKDITAPLKAIQTVFEEEFNGRKIKARGTLKALNAKLTGIQNTIQGRVAKDATTNTSDLQRQLQDVEAEKQTLLDSLKGGAWVVDDITPEKLLVTMARTYDRAVFLSSEARGLQNILGQSYGTGSAVSTLTKAWDGETLKRDRIGSSDEVSTSTIVRSPSISLVATYTPALFAATLRNHEFRNSGFLSRCLCLSLHAVRRSYATDAFYQKSLTAWQELITTLAGIPVPVDDNGHVTPHPVSIEESAYKRYRKECQRIHDGIYECRHNYSEDVSQWLNRFDLQILRIAAILHLVRHRTKYASQQIGQADIAAAFQVMQYYVFQFVNLLDSHDGAATDSNLVRVMKYACGQHSGFTKSTINRAVRVVGNGTQASLIAGALKECLERGWLTYNPDLHLYTVTREYRDSQG